LSVRNESFRIPITESVWSSPILCINGVEIVGDIPIGYDSDGKWDDQQKDRTTKEGVITVVSSMAQMPSLVDRMVVVNATFFVQHASYILDSNPAAVIIITSHPVSIGTGILSERWRSFFEHSPSTIPLLVETETLQDAGLVSSVGGLRDLEGKKVSIDVDADFIFGQSNTLSQNVMATLRGNTYPETRIVASAHMDSANTPGANDNGSGLAVLLETAYAFAELDLNPLYTIEFVAFGAEEIGMLGSSDYAWRYSPSKILAAINIDTVGRGSSYKIGMAYPDRRELNSNDELDKILFSAAKVVEIVPSKLTEFFGGLTDSVNFHAMGIPATDIVVLPDGGVFDLEIHSPYDTPELVDNLTLERTAETLAIGLARIATKSLEKAEITMVLDTTPRIASITVDGVTYQASQLPVKMNWTSGSTHTFCVEEAVTVSSSVRYVFVGWNDGINVSSRSIEAISSAFYIASFKIQFYLSIASKYGEVVGEGWYDEGAIAFPQVNPTKIDYFPYQFRFVGWSERYPMLMDRPKRVFALWEENMAPIFYVMTALVLILLAVGILILKSRRALKHQAILDQTMLEKKGEGNCKAFHLLLTALPC